MPLRLAIALVLTVLVVSAAGCGGSSIETGEVRTGTITSEVQIPAPGARNCETEAVDAEGLRATGVACGKARATMLAWQRARSCAPPAGASRGSCSIRSYRCVAAATARGTAVSCSRPGESIAFRATRP